MNQVLLIATLALLSEKLHAHSQDPLILHRLKGPITLDGLSNEPAWAIIDPLPMTMYTPTYEGQLTETTEIRLAYDDEYLYIAGRLYDSDSSGIQANSLVRDVDRGGDFMNVFLDTFNDKQNMSVFMTTPAGNRLDAEVINDAEGDDFWNMGWNSYWDCAVVQNGLGWFVEMRIPFSSLRFQDDHGRVRFGFIVHRLISRKNERQTFPAIPPRKQFSAWKASEAQEIVLDGIYSKNPVYVSPYVLGERELTTSIDPAARRVAAENNVSREFGIDVKYGFTNNLSLDLTANPDFAQVEADAQQVNLTRYSLFYPELRQFFQERSGIFDFRYAGMNKLFDSRRIGLTPDAKPVRILGGARIVGRFADWDIGTLDMQTESAYGLPSENFGVLRIRRNIINRDSYLGSMVTTRLGRNEEINVASGLDGSIRLAEYDYLSTQLIQVFQKGRPAIDFRRNGVFCANWERRTTEGPGGNIMGMYIGDNYNPGIGFNQRKGISALEGSFIYGWFVNGSSVLRKHTATVSWTYFRRNSDRSTESGTIDGMWASDLNSGASLVLEVARLFDGLQDTLTFSSSANVPRGNYAYTNVKISYVMSPGLLLRSDIALEAGSFYDGERFALDIVPTWNVSRYLEVGGEYQFNRVRFIGRHELFDAHIVRFRIKGATDEKFSISLLTQYSSAADIIGNNIQLRYNFREGTDLFFVYNPVLNTNRQRFGFSLPLEDNSVAVLKLVYTFVPI